MVGCQIYIYPVVHDNDHIFMLSHFEENVMPFLKQHFSGIVIASENIIPTVNPNPLPISMLPEGRKTVLGHVNRVVNDEWARLFIYEELLLYDRLEKQGIPRTIIDLNRPGTLGRNFRNAAAEFESLRGRTVTFEQGAGALTKFLNARTPWYSVREHTMAEEVNKMAQTRGERDCIVITVGADHANGLKRMLTEKGHKVAIVGEKQRSPVPTSILRSQTSAPAAIPATNKAKATC